MKNYYYKRKNLLNNLIEELENVSVNQFLNIKQVS